MTDWPNKINATQKPEQFKSSLADLLRHLLSGRDPFGKAVNSATGARMCVNIAAVHIPGFCRRSTGANAFLNTYDLEKKGNGTWKVSGRRKRVDAALPMQGTQTPETTYFGAIELTGAGVRFYGDFAMILKPSAALKNSTILERNSFELLRPPLRTEVVKRKKTVTNDFDLALGLIAQEMSGKWSADLDDIMTLKLLDAIPSRERGLTVGMLTARIIEDEDYVEVLKAGSFNAYDLQETRVSAADAGMEARIGDHLFHGPTPSIGELLWRRQRRSAVAALQAYGVATHTVVSAGRIRS